MLQPESHLVKLLEEGLRYHQSGNFTGAHHLYSQVLEQDPSCADALHLLGVLSYQNEHYTEAINLIQCAIASNSTIPSFYYNLGNCFKDLKDLEAAQHCYQQALQRKPDYYVAYQALGHVFQQQKKSTEALICYQQALKLATGNADIYNDLGVVLQDLGDVEQAIEHYHRSLVIKPDFSEAFHNLLLAYYQLAHLHEEQDALDTALTYYQQIIQIKPDESEAYHFLGNIYHTLDKPDQAIEVYTQALALKPNNAIYHNNLAHAFYKQGQFDSAIEHYQQALALDPNHPDILNNLGNALNKRGQNDQAKEAYQQAIALQPDYAEAYYNLGNLLNEQRELTQAMACYHKALQLKPDYLKVYNNLGNVLKEQGQLEAALNCYQQAIAVIPIAAHSNLLFCMGAMCDYTKRNLFEQAKLWSLRYAKPLLPAILVYAHNRDPGKRLRIGYVSADFRFHATAFFIEGLLANHTFETVCYADVEFPDATTEYLHSLASHWRSTVHLTDDKMAELIQQDQIDILVDLSGHTSGNRLLVFARKPTPIQITYYPTTTGLSMIDYRITDPYLDPEHKVHLNSEKLLYLPHCFLCYTPSANTPPVLPLQRPSCLTFGSFNNLIKLNPTVIKTWAHILKQVPDSRLFLKASQFHDAPTKERYYSLFEQEGIHRSRITLEKFALSLTNHLTCYQQIDIALDPFPYNGMTTTCEALWMGVPVITLAGSTWFGRAGLSILTNLGLNSLIARSIPEYIQLAVSLAVQSQQLAQWRQSLRDSMIHSVLCDAKQFTQAWEQIYRAIWNKWCVQ